MDSQTKIELLKSFDILFEEALEAVGAGDFGVAYKSLIKAAAITRSNMTQAECRKASVELILEADGQGVT